MEQQEIIIRISKTKILGLFGLSLCFVILGIWIAFYAPDVKVEILNSDLLKKSVGFLSILFFGFMGVLILKKLFENKIAIRISSEGIYEYSTVINNGLIKWENIEKIEPIKVYTQKFIRIIVNNPQDFISRQKNILIRKNIQVSQNKYGSPIQISTNGLNISFDELYNLLNEEFKKRK